MLRHALLSVLPTLIVLGCASTSTVELLDGGALEPRSSGANLRVEPVAPADSAYELVALPATVEPEPLSVATASAPASFAADESLHESRFTIKGGLWGSEEDALDDGWILNLSWMRFFTRMFALELEAGYLDADGTDNGIKAEVWGLPLMVNGRLNLPVWILDVYGGLGIGAIYFDADTSGAASLSDDGFLLGGNAFLGATINLADSVALGLEGKYYTTEESSDLDAGLDAFALMLTLGFGR